MRSHGLGRSPALPLIAMLEPRIDRMSMEIARKSYPCRRSERRDQVSKRSLFWSKTVAKLELFESFRDGLCRTAEVGLRLSSVSFDNLKAFLWPATLTRPSASRAIPFEPGSEP